MSRRCVARNFNSILHDYISYQNCEWRTQMVTNPSFSFELSPLIKFEGKLSYAQNCQTSIVS